MQMVAFRLVRLGRHPRLPRRWHGLVRLTGRSSPYIWHCFRLEECSPPMAKRLAMMPGSGTPPPVVFLLCLSTINIFCNGAAGLGVMGDSWLPADIFVAIWELKHTTYLIRSLRHGRTAHYVIRPVVSYSDCIARWTHACDLRRNKL